MHLRQFLLSMLCSLAPLFIGLSYAQHVDSGSIRGSVWSGAEDVSARWTIVVSGPNFRREVRTDSKAHFKVKVPPGIYFVFIKSKDKVDSRLHMPFRVWSDKERVIELDATERYASCSPTGERIIPIEPGRTTIRPNRPPEIDEFTVLASPKERLKIVVQYCGKEKVDNRITYTSAMVKSETITLYANQAVLSLNDFVIESLRRTDVVFFGVRGETHQGFLKASLNGGSFGIEARSRGRK